MGAGLHGRVIFSMAYMRWLESQGVRTYAFPATVSKLEGCQSRTPTRR